MQAMIKDDRAAKADAATVIIDHLVAALGGEPSCTLRRAVVFTDIDQHPGTTQTDIMARTDLDKSSMNRDIEWLYDYGCITRTPGGTDGRTIKLRTCGYAKKNLGLALEYFEFSHENLKYFLTGFISLFGQHKPTLRDAKIVSVIGKNGAISRARILDNLYQGPTTTDNRAVNNLINSGLVQKNDDERT